MKLRHYIIALVAMPIFSACSSDDMPAPVRQDSDMMFQARANISPGWTLITRGEPVPNIEALPDNYKLSVSSYFRHEAGDNNQSCAFLKKFPLTFVSTGTSSTWKAAGCFWPLSGSMDFIGWATSGSEQITPDKITFNGNSDFEDNFTGMEIDFGTSLDGTADILYSNLAAHATRSDASVPFTFEHSTTCVVVSLAAGDELTKEKLGISSVAFANVPISGKLHITPAADTGYPNLTELTSIKTNSEWRDIIRAADHHLPRFEAAADPTDNTKRIPVKLDFDPIEQARYFVPGKSDSDLVVAYTVNGTTRSFAYHFDQTWQRALRHNYRFTVTLRQIIVGAEEEQWDTEIGGTAFEPEWSTEIGGNASEATWGVEIGGEAYEVTWKVEIAATALEASWVSEIGASANENNWNSEIGAGANENNWNSEVGAGANENNWNSEIGAGASENNWNSEVGAGASENNWNSEVGTGASENNWNSEVGAGASENNWNSETGAGAYEEQWTEDTTDPTPIPE